MSELKPCPRCGAEAHVVTEDGEPTMFLCEDCGCWLDVSEYETTENAFKWWNDRPFIDALTARIAELKELLDTEIQLSNQFYLLLVDNPKSKKLADDLIEALRINGKEVQG